VNAGLLRSLLIYYGQPQKLLRMIRFYRQLIHPGDLSFDLGAHVGSRVWAWRKLGARVVALEPNPACMSLLKKLYGSQPGITLLDQAVGSIPGEQTLYISQNYPAVSTLSKRWISSVQEEKSFSRVRWEETRSIPVTTLDALVACYGEPAFCKIDIEGYELEALRGLNRPLRALSFEYLPPVRKIALGCLERLAELGDYVYNWTERETHRLKSEKWLRMEEMALRLSRLRPEGPSGDILARLVQDSRV
jgi:FkbM family methyltransferase